MTNSAAHRAFDFPTSDSLPVLAPPTGTTHLKRNCLLRFEMSIVSMSITWISEKPAGSVSIIREACLTERKILQNLTPQSSGADNQNFGLLPEEILGLGRQRSQLGPRLPLSRRQMHRPSKDQAGR